MKRLLSIDAIRAIAILTITPLHAVLMFNTNGGDPQFTWDPIDTAPLFFFFISGMCLALSVERRRKNKNLKALFPHYLYRYGGYILLSISISLIVTLIDSIFMDLGDLGKFFGVEAIHFWVEPIRGIGLACLSSLPIVYYLSWRKLLNLFLFLFPLTSIILYNIHDVYLFGYFTPIFITGMYSLLKTVPTILLGAGMGKLILKNLHQESLVSSLSRKLIITGIGILMLAYLIYFFTFYLLNVNITLSLILLKVGGPYYTSTIFNLGGFIFIFGLFERLRLKGYKFRPLTFVGQTGIQIFYVHIPLLILLRSIIDPAMLTDSSYLIVVTLPTFLMYIFAYFYVKYDVNTRGKKLLKYWLFFVKVNSKKTSKFIKGSNG